MNYFKNKDELKEKAISHNREMEQFYSHETLKSIRDSIIIDNTKQFLDVRKVAVEHRKFCGIDSTYGIRLEDTDTVSV